MDISRRPRYPDAVAAQVIATHLTAKIAEGLALAVNQECNHDGAQALGVVADCGLPAVIAAFWLVLPLGSIGLTAQDLQKAAEQKPEKIDRARRHATTCRKKSLPLRCAPAAGCRARHRARASAAAARHADSAARGRSDADHPCRWSAR